MFEKILLAYDGSDCARRASEYAKKLALKFGSQVDVVYAFGPVPRSWDASVAQPTMEAETNQGRAVIGEVLDWLKSAGVDAHGAVIEGLEADVISMQIQHNQSDLVVIGAEGLDPTISFLLGSVSDKVVHRASCPVLVVK